MNVMNWEEMKEKYPTHREEMTLKQEKEFVDDCFKLYEAEGFSKVFWSPRGDLDNHHGKEFEVIGRCSEQECDLSIMPMWDICFENGMMLSVYPEEVIPSEMVAHGCKLAMVLEQAETQGKSDEMNEPKKRLIYREIGDEKIGDKHIGFQDVRHALNEITKRHALVIGDWEKNGWSVREPSGEFLQRLMYAKPISNMEIWDENGHLYFGFDNQEGHFTEEILVLTDVGAEYFAYNYVEEGQFLEDLKSKNYSELPRYAEKVLGTPAEEWEEKTNPDKTVEKPKKGTSLGDEAKDASRASQALGDDGRDVRASEQGR